MFRLFVIVTGWFDILLGLYIGFSATPQADNGLFLYPIMIGSFLVFCGACLVWAAQDIPTRAPVIFWQALVRLTAVVTILIGVPSGWVGSENLAAAVMDGIVAPIYLVGVCRALRVSPFRLLIGRTN